MGYTTVGSSIGREDVTNTSSVISNGAYPLEQHGPHVASVIQRSGPSPPSSSYPSNGSGSRHAVAFYSYQQPSHSRSPSPARGGAHCNGVVATTMAGQRATGTAASPLHSHSNVSNGSSAASSQRSYQSSPKMMEVEPYVQQQQLHGGYNNNATCSLNHHSSSSSTSSTHPSYPRVDDLASRSHRLEEALLRASRKSPPVAPPSTAAAASSSSSSSSSSAAAHFNAGNSGRTSADELLDLKKRSGYSCPPRPLIKKKYFSRLILIRPRSSGHSTNFFRNL